MKTIHECRVCRDVLTNENWSPSFQKKGDSICKECHTKNVRLYQKNNPDKVKAVYERCHKNNGGLPMGKNKDCPSYLGVHVAELLLRHLYNDVEVMPYGTPGYDIICNKGMKIDVKSGCIIKNRHGWMFHINHNIIADYFICVAFDNREDLNPLHIWLIPGHVLNHLTGASISPSSVHRWNAYKQNIGEALACCDSIKKEI